MVTVSNNVIYQDTKCVYFLIFPEKAIGGTVFPGGGKPYLGKVAFFLGNVSVHGHRGELWLIFSPLGSGTIWCDATFSMWSRPTLPVNVFCMFHRWDICAAPNKEYIPFCSAPAFPPFITLQLTTGQEASAHPIASALLPFTRKHASHSPGLPNHPTACTPLCKMLQILAFPTFYALPVLGITQPRWKIGGKLPVRRTFLHRNIRDVIASPSSLLH